MQKKILIVIIINIILVSVTLGIISYVSIHESIAQALNSKLALAKILSKYVDIFLHYHQNKLYDVSRTYNININIQDKALRQRMLKDLYENSNFTEGVFLLDRHGNTLQIYPERIEYHLNLSHIASVNEALREGLPVISNVYMIEPIQKRVIFIISPLKDTSGKVIGIVGGIIGPTSEFFSELLMSAKKEWGGYAEIIDSNEIIVASSNPSLVFQPHNHDSVISKMIKTGKSDIIECHHPLGDEDHTNDNSYILAVVPLNIAPWAIIIGQPENIIFAPAVSLQMEFIFVVLIFICISTLISIQMSKRIVRPLKSLISSANRLASGDLTTPVGNLGSDEILKLSNSFDEMRQKLAESLENIRTYNIELENKVALRTKEIEENRQQIEQLYMKVIKSEEDERKRVARDLHDSILQDISALLIQLEICKMHPEIISADKIDGMREVIVKAIDNIHNIIKNLRPSMLDEIGLEAAINELVNTYLTRKGIACNLEIESSISGILPSDAEISIFRMVQEAIINIARHSKAENVFIKIDIINDSLFKVLIEDDGVGFNVEDLMHLPSQNGRGLGIIGMRERASLLGGDLMINSEPEKGTRICFEIPIKGETEHA